MKNLTALSLLILLFTSCTSVEYQQMRNERERLREAYEDARRENDKLTLKNALYEEVLGTWQILGIEVLEGDTSEEILAAKTALTSASRKNLTFRFFKHNNIYWYEGNNGSINISGEFAITINRTAARLYPFLKLSRGSGIAPPEFLINASGNNLSAGISVRDERLYLLFHGQMLLSPGGWIQSGGLRCVFKKIE